MKLDKGWILDLEPHERPLGSWSNARNMVYSKKSKRLINESGFELDYQDTKNIIGKIEVSDRLIIFSTDNTISEIGQYTEADGYTTILKSFYLNFNDNYPIAGNYRFNNNGELIIVWNDNYNPPRLLNINNLPFTLGYAEKVIRDGNWVRLDISLIENNEYKLSIIDTEGTNTDGISLYNSGSISRVDWQTFFEKTGNDNDEFTSTYNCDRISIKPNGFTYLKIGITELGGNSKWLMDGSKANLLQLFPNMIYPNLSFELLNETSNLTSGIYYIAISYLVDLNDSTNWLLINTPIILSNKEISKYLNETEVEDVKKYLNDKLEAKLDKIDGVWKAWNKEGKDLEKRHAKYEAKIAYDEAMKNIARSDIEIDQTYDTLQNKSIKFTILNIDQSFQFFKLAIIKVTNLDVVANMIGTFKIDSDNFTYRYGGQVSKVSIDTSEILISLATFNKCKSITTSVNQLIAGNITLEEEIDYQIYANLITLEWDTKRYGIGDKVEDAKVLFDLRNKVSTNGGIPAFLYNFDYINYNGFQADEVYAFYIHLVFKNGVVSKGFHIPGRMMNEGEDSVMNTYPTASANEQLLADWVKLYHIRDTANYTDKSLSYWENIEETYPYTDSFNSSSIAGSNYDLRGKNVRHHKMPSYKTINNNDSGIRKNNTLLGIKFKNIIIPQNIKDNIVGFKFSYAKRNMSNSTIIDESLILLNNHIQDNFNYRFDDLNNNKYYRAYSYPLLSTKPSLNITYIKNQYNSIGTSNEETKPTITNVTISSYPSEANSIQVISDVNYIPENNIAIANERREGFIKLEVPDDEDLIFGNAFPNTVSICSLVSLKQNVYFPFYEQELVEFTKTYYTYNVSEILDSEVAYTGDVTLRVDAIATTSPDYSTDSDGNPVSTKIGNVISGNKLFYYVLQSRFPNIGDSNRYNVFYTRFNNTLNIPGGSQGILGLNWGYEPNETDNGLAYDELTWNKYNYDLSWTNNIKYLIPFNPYIELQTAYVNRLYRSLTFDQVDGSIGWRKFLVNEYFDITRDKGAINNLENLGDVLFIHTSSALFLGKLKDVIITNSGSIYLGSGDLFDRQPIEIIPDNIGYAGNQNQFGTCVCKHGYIFPSREQGKIFLVNDGIKEISNEGISSVIEYYLKNIYTNTESEYNFINGDNPYKANGIAIGYEELNNRILISIKNEQYTISSIEETVLEGLKSKIELVFVSATPSSTITLNLFNGTDVVSHIFTCVDTIVNQMNEFIFDNDNEVIAASFLTAVNYYLFLINATSLYNVQRDVNKVIIEAINYGDEYNFNPIITGGLYVKESGVDNAGSGAAAQEWCPEGHFINGTYNTSVNQNLYNVQHNNTTVLLLACPRDMPDAFELLIAPAGTELYVKVATTCTYKLNNQGVSSNHGYPNTGEFYRGTPSGSGYYNARPDIQTGSNYLSICPCYGSNPYNIPPLYHKNLANPIFIGEDKPKDDGGLSACTTPKRNVYSRLDEFNSENNSEILANELLFTIDGHTYIADNGDGMQLLWKINCNAGDKIKVRAIGASNITGYAFNLRQILNQSSVITETHVNNYTNIISKPIFTKTGVSKNITLSYSFEILEGKWVSRHDYICNAYMRTMDKLYYLLNNSFKFHIYRPSLLNWGGFTVEQDKRVIHFDSSLDDSVNEGIIIDSQSLQNGKLTNAGCLLMTEDVSTINLPNTIEIDSDSLTYKGTCLLAVDSTNKFQLKTTKNGKLYDLSFTANGLSYHFSCAEIYKNVTRSYYYIHNSLFYGSVALVINASWSTQNEYFYLQEFGYDKTTNSENASEYIIVPKLQEASQYSQNRAAYLIGFDLLNPFIPTN